MEQYIQNLQNPQSYKDYTDKYLENSLQSLANLGQRTLYNNNVLSYSTYSFSDLSIDEDKKKLTFVELKKEGKYVSVSLYDKKNDETYPYRDDEYTLIYQTLNNLDKNNNTKLLQNVFTNYRIYDNYISKEEDKLTVIIKFGLEDNPGDHPVDLLYVQYQNNKVSHIIYVTEYNNSNYSITNPNSNSFVLYKIDLNEDGESYNVNIILFSDENIKDIIKSFDEYDESKINDIKFTDLYNIQTNEDSINYIFSIIKSYGENYEDLINFEKNNINNTPFVNILLNYANDENYNIIGDDRFVFKDNKLNNIHNSKLDSYITDNEFGEVGHIIEFCKSNYQSLLENYNKFLYGTKNILFLQVLYELYKSIKKSNLEKDRILVPLNYKFSYICDKNDESHIYFSNYINILSCDISDIKNEDINQNIIYYDSPSNVNNISVWNFDFYYNEFYNIIEKIEINKIYTMPYINSLYNWVVNDIDTEINALNIIDNSIKILMVYVDKENQNIINVNNINYTNLNFVEVENIQIPNKYFSEYDNKTITFNTYIPQVTKYNKDYLQNTLLYIITNKNMINEEENSSDYQLDYCAEYIYTLWRFNGENFELIKNLNNSDDYFFDPFNNQEIISMISNSKNNSVSALKVLYNDKVNQLNNPNKWVIQRNKIGTLYSENYNNNLNLSTEISSRYVRGNEKINYTQNRYISDLSSINTTNELYPIWNISKQSKIISEYQTEVENKLITVDLEGVAITIDIDNNNAVSSNYIISQDKLISIVKIESKNKEISYDVYSLSDKNYKEYIPNIDVPTIDNKEMLMRNINVVNRLNVIEFEEGTSPYNGYIGHKIDDEEKALVIGTSKLNINVGTDTLIPVSQRDKFNTFNKLKTDGFNEIEINANKSIKINKQILNQTNSNYITTSIIPIGILSSNTIKFGINTSEKIYIKYQNDSSDDFDYTSLGNNILFKYFEYNNNKLFMGIYLNNLISRIFNETELNDSGENVLKDMLKSNDIELISDNLIIDSQFSSKPNEHYYFMIINKDIVEDLSNKEIVFNKQINFVFNQTNNSKKIYIDFDDTTTNTPKVYSLTNSINISPQNGKKIEIKIENDNI